MEKTFDVIVIGSGPGGYVAAIKCAQLGLKVCCVEKEKVLGGTCLNVGCIPSKTLLHASEFYFKMQHEAPLMGISADPKMDFSTLQQRKEGVVKGFNAGIGSLFKKNNVTSIQGSASFIDPHTVQVGDISLKAKHFILATGSKPVALPFLPFDETAALSSTGALALKTPPKEMVVVGCGVIGVELGSVYSRLGTKVTFVEAADRICPGLDIALSSELQKLLTAQGMRFHLSAKVVSAKVEEGRAEILLDTKNLLVSEKVLVCIGRKAYTQGLNLEKLGIPTTRSGQIAVNGNFQIPEQPHILAIGDLIDGPMLAHKASDEGVAAAKILAGKSGRVEYLTIPSVVYTYPEAASVGLSEEAAKEMGFSIKTAKVPFKANSRARASFEEMGFVKLIAQEGTLRLLGCHIIGAHAGELIHEVALALHKRGTAHDLENTSHAHPTLAEAIKEGAHALISRSLHL